MKKKLLAGIITAGLVTIFVFLTNCDSAEKRYHQLSVEEIDRDIRQVVQSDKTTAEKMEYFSAQFLNAPYDLTCQGDGPYARYETQPLLNLKNLNCMTYCEIVLALSLSDYYEDFFNVLQHIRYREGIIGMATRNHYTMADWLPANSWCLDDVSALCGGTDTAQLTRTISHQRFFRRKGIDDIPVMLPNHKLTIDYIPLDKLAAHEDAFQSGDIVALIKDLPAIFSAHMLLIIKKDGQTYFRHASMSAGKVLDSPFLDYVNGLQKSAKYQGMCFMRVKDNIQWRDGNYTHGKFLLPESE